MKRSIHHLFSWTPPIGGSRRERSFRACYFCNGSPRLELYPPKDQNRVPIRVDSRNRRIRKITMEQAAAAAAADEDEQPATSEPEPGLEPDEDEDEDTEQPAADEDEPPSSRTRGSSRAVTAAAGTVSAANEPVRGPGTLAQKRSRQRQRSQTGSKRRKKKKAVKVNGKRGRGWVDVASKKSKGPRKRSCLQVRHAREHTTRADYV